MPSLRFSRRKARFNKSFGNRLNHANAATSLPFFNLLPIVAGFCITISICDSFLQTQFIMIFATVWAVACVRRDPEIFSRDLRIVTRSVHDV